jgi:uncharacterized protein
MSDKVADRIVSFVGAHIANLKILKIEWFGGEPLLNLPLVVRLTSQFRDMCQDCQVVFRSSMTSNGFLLTKAVAEQLAGAGVSSVQVTIDGTQEVHDALRPRKGGGGTYERILSNALAARDHLDVSVRANVSRNNVQCLERFYKEMKAIGLADVLHIERTTSEANEFANGCVVDELSLEEFSSAEMTSIRRLMTMEELKYRLLPRSSFCAAGTLGMFVVDPKGYLYKCWHEVGMTEQAIGTLDNDVALNPNHVRWLSATPHQYEECRTCRILPLCQGGCFFQRFRTNDKAEWCAPMKRNIRELLSFAAHSTPLR